MMCLMIVGYLTEIDTGVIDAAYMNSRFDKYLKMLHQEGASAESLEEAKTSFTGRLPRCLRKSRNMRIFSARYPEW